MSLVRASIADRQDSIICRIVFTFLATPLILLVIAGGLAMA